MQTTVSVNLGFQKKVEMGVSLLGSVVQTFSYDCLNKLGGRQYVACNNAPILATPYFNATTYSNQATQDSATYDGYTMSGYSLNTAACLSAIGAIGFCTTQN